MILIPTDTATRSTSSRSQSSITSMSSTQIPSQDKLLTQKMSRARLKDREVGSKRTRIPCSQQESHKTFRQWISGLLLVTYRLHQCSSPCSRLRLYRIWELLPELILRAQCLPRAVPYCRNKQQHSTQLHRQTKVGSTAANQEPGRVSWFSTLNQWSTKVWLIQWVLGFTWWRGLRSSQGSAWTQEYNKTSWQR